MRTYYYLLLNLFIENLQVMKTMFMSLRMVRGVTSEK